MGGESLAFILVILQKVQISIQRLIPKHFQVILHPDLVIDPLLGGGISKYTKRNSQGHEGDFDTLHRLGVT